MHARLTFLRFDGFFLPELAPGELSASSAALLLGSLLTANVGTLDVDGTAAVVAGVVEVDAALDVVDILEGTLDGEDDDEYRLRGSNGG